MNSKVKSFWRGWGRMQSQRGFTLAEVMIAVIISALLLVGSFAIMRHMIVTSSDDRAKANALLQVQYVGFWITEDVMQARPAGVQFGDTANLADADDGQEFPVLSYPLVIEWKDWNSNVHHTEYRFQTGDNGVGKLTRENEINGVSEGLTIVGESLDPAGTKYTKVTGTGNVTPVLKLDVKAVGDPYATDTVKRYEVSRTYEINPRSK